MSIETHKSAQACGVCGAHVNELRRGRCWGCFQKWVEARPVGRGASCLVCNERRREHLRLSEIQGRSLPLCHGCAARVQKLEAAPHSIEGLRIALRRDRRYVERRDGALDQRVFPRERRATDRRLDELDAAAGDGMVFLDESAGDVMIELDVQDIDIVEETSVTLLDPLAVAAAAAAVAAAALAADAAAADAATADAATADAAADAPAADGAPAAGQEAVDEHVGGHEQLAASPG